MSSSDEAVVIWGEVLWDRFPEGDQLGGAPANVAYHLGQAGGWARLVSRVGNDELGKRALERLGAYVDTSLIQVDAERPTGEVGVSIEAGEPRYTLHADRAWERIACTPSTATAIAEAGVLIFGTLSQRTGEGLAGWRQAIAAATDTCLKVCDINLRRVPGLPATPEVREALDAADVIKVNDRELGILAGWYGWADPIAALRASTKVLAVTHGAGGSTLYGDAAPIHIPGVHARPGGDNVGCGDAYLAILVLGMTMGWDLSASGHAASRYAAAVAEARGATPMFDDARIAELLGDDE
ncbi:MAG: carbohydrate kinase [Deltaproteobacteria bacterium]|nr:carbohydrate kinase [Deltaproteobacteria bacterium]